MKDWKAEYLSGVSVLGYHRFRVTGPKGYKRTIDIACGNDISQGKKQAIETGKRDNARKNDSL